MRIRKEFMGLGYRGLEKRVEPKGTGVMGGGE